jgi:hypothetical protein
MQMQTAFLEAIYIASTGWINRSKARPSNILKPLKVYSSGQTVTQTIPKEPQNQTTQECLSALQMIALRLHYARYNIAKRRKP